jgi:nucleoside-diphosphate-sugar epimerase
MTRENSRAGDAASAVAQHNARLRVFLTGGGRGFIGGHLVSALEHAGHDVHRDWVDIRDLSVLQRAVRGCDAVVHAAALYSNSAPVAEIEAVNVGGTANVDGLEVGSVTDDTDR